MEGSAKELGLAVLGKLPKYDGRSDIQQFIKLVNKRSLVEGWTDEQKAIVIKYLCSDLAEAFLDANPELNALGYPQLCESLTARFALKISKPEAYAQLLGVKQNRRTVAEYAGAIESTAAALNSVIGELKVAATREELLTSVFMNGADQSLKKALVTSDFEKFGDIVRAASKLETTLNESKRTVAFVQETGDNPVSNPSGIAHNTGVVCWRCNKLGHISRFCRSPPLNSNVPGARQHFPQYPHRPQYNPNPIHSYKPQYNNYPPYQSNNPRHSLSPRYNNTSQQHNKPHYSPRHSVQNQRPPLLPRPSLPHSPTSGSRHSYNPRAGYKPHPDTRRCSCTDSCGCNDGQKN